ncbi:FtsX-like permease family protein [Streptomonospora litoralis]|uniref:FtsX-like permease family protein n=1 Tax=Streptomonospora litoralis TaxID=2498135 RepID=A0A4P6QAB3_9ACTN|nr:FtsX-like permease family protein [Streptomonospora litoralis]QBI56354.1 FtsX-like permease family protein [Streptomonospora litoralis]
MSRPVAGSRPSGSAPVRWVREAVLGARMSVSGGGDAWLRLALIAVGIGAAVALLLAAAAAPNVIGAREERESARTIAWTDQTPPKSERTLLMAQADTEYYGQSVYGRLVAAEGPRAPVPPGIAEVPEAGQMVVSPALARLLDSPEGELLRKRLDYRIVGTIGEEGLLGPGELAYYAGTEAETLSPANPSVERLDRLGYSMPDAGLVPAVLLLVLVGAVVALLPLGVFVAAALRLGSDKRDRRLAALRLLGADRWTAARIACGEALTGALAGIALGAGVFLLLRAGVESVQVAGISAFTTDVVPLPSLAAAVLIGVVALAVTVTLVSTARTVADPLGVTRRASRPRRRLWWRLAIPAAGLGLLYPVFTASEDIGAGLSELQLVGGLLLFLSGAGLLTPWVFQVAVSRARRGGPAWLLAVRRLRADGAAETRAVAGVAVIAAGAIAVQTLFTGVQQNFENPLQGQETGPAYSARIPDVSMSAASGTTEGLRSLPQVHNVHATADYHDPSGRDPVRLTVGECTALRASARIDRCEAGDVFLVGNKGGGVAPGDELELSGSGDSGERASWVLPASTRRVPAADSAEAEPGHTAARVLATPGAVAGAGLPRTSLWVDFDIASATPRATEEVRTAILSTHPLADMAGDSRSAVQEQVATVGALVTAAIATSLAVIGLGLLISTIDQLRESRQPLAVLAASGVRRRTLAVSVLYQATIPLAVGLAAAVVMGTAMGAILLRIVEYPVGFDLGTVVAITGGAALVGLAVSLLSLPALTRLVRPDNLRAE